MRIHIPLVLGLALATPAPAVGQEPPPPDSLEARVWLDRGDDPVVQRGDEVRVYYRTSADAWVAIFRIDTDGFVSLIFPQHPEMDTAVRGGRDYRLLFPGSARWRVDEDPGAGYFFMVASPEPLDFSALGWDDDLGWDLGEVGATVYEDPYVAIDDYVAAIVPDWEVVPYALDFLTYSVGDTHEYPRFLCYDCHGFRSYGVWNPYDDFCSTYRVVIWDDPYFYPRYRYVGTRVVFARPFGPRPRYGVVRRVAGAGVAPLVRTRAAPPRRAVEFKESPRPPSYQPRNPAPPRGSVSAPARRRAGPGGGPATSRGPASVSPGARAAPRPSARPSPSGGARTATPPATSVRPPSATGATTRGTLRRRPPAPSARLPARAAPPRATPSRQPTRAIPRSGVSTPRPPSASRPGTRRPPPRAAPARPGASSPRPSGANRPPTRPPPRATGSRPPPRSSAGRPPSRPPPRATGSGPATGRPTPRRPRPGGRGRGG